MISKLMGIKTLFSSLTSHRFNSSNRFQDHRHYILRRETQQLTVQQYFEDKFDKIKDQEISSIIKVISNTQQANTIFKKKLSQYLDVQYSRTRIMQPINYFYLLVAINLHPDKTTLEYRKNIMQYLFRMDIQQITMDPLMLYCFIDAYNLIQKGYNAKKKTQLLTLNYLKIVMNHIDRLDFGYIPQFMLLLIMGEDNKLQYLQFAHLIQSKVIEEISKKVKGIKIDQSIHFIILHPQFIPNLVKLYNIYGCKNEEEIYILFKFIQKNIFRQKILKQNHTISILLRIYRQFPIRYRSNDGKFYKEQILKNIILYLQGINFLENQIHSRYRHYFCSSVIHQLFYQYWMNLQFCQLNGTIFLQKKQVQTSPELPQLFWKVYNKYPQEINALLVTRDTIKNCYPSKYIDNQLEQKVQVKQPYVETQMRIRMELALIKMGLIYQKEVKISHRYIDFLLQNNVILQLDGRHHFYLNHFENDQNTIYRNLHLILAGYRIIIINIHQYNCNREVDQLVDLFKQKMDVLEKYECVAVL